VREHRRKLAADAWGSLLRVHAELVPVLDRLLRQQTGMPLARYDVLLELSAAPRRRLTMGALGERVVLSRTRVSRVVDELVTEGLVRRERNPADARSAYATMTARGVAAFKRAAPIYLNGIEQHFAAGLSDVDLRHLVRALEATLERVP
jgi:DNA-binding MarR family transcriptional regulator